MDQTELSNSLSSYLIFYLLAATKKAASSKIIFTNQAYNMNKQFLFWGGRWGEREHSRIPTCSLSRKNIFSTIFYNNTNMCFKHTFLMELEWIYYILFINWSILLYSFHTLSVCRVWRTLPLGIPGKREPGP